MHSITIIHPSNHKVLELFYLVRIPIIFYFIFNNEILLEPPQLNQVWNFTTSYQSPWKVGHFNVQKISRLVSTLMQSIFCSKVPLEGFKRLGNNVEIKREVPLPADIKETTAQQLVLASSVTKTLPTQVKTEISVLETTSARRGRWLGAGVVYLATPRWRIPLGHSLLQLPN